MPGSCARRCCHAAHTDPRPGVIVLHTLVERYLDQLRSDSGKDESIRLALDDEQDMLVEIQSRLHELSREVRSAR